MRPTHIPGVESKSQSLRPGVPLRLLWAGCASIALHASALTLLPQLSHPDDKPVREMALHARIVQTPPAEAHEIDPVLKSALPAEAPPAAPAARPEMRDGAGAKDRTASAGPDARRAQPLSQADLEHALTRLSETLFYPPEALARGLEGEVIVMIELDATGRIVAAAIAGSSGHALLDDAALRAVRHIGPLPAVAGRTILLPVRFSLL